MNGAAETGRVAAEKIIEKMDLTMESKNKQS
jgi:hypothetical protein